MNESTRTDCLLGGALGDALGLPAEGLTSRRIARMWRGSWRHRFFFGKGMVSDDTEHAVMTASPAPEGSPERTDCSAPTASTP